MATIKFNEEADKIVKRSVELAKKFKFNNVGIESLFLAILSFKECGPCKILNNHGINYENVSLLASEWECEDLGVINEKLTYSTELKLVVKKASNRAKNFDEEEVSPMILAYSMFTTNDPFLNSVLENYAINKVDIIREFDVNYSEKNKLNTIPELTLINKYVKKNHKELIGRDKEMILLIESLLRKEKPNAILVGEPGVGKTQLIYELAHLINKNQVCDELKNKLIYELDISNVVAGTKYRGEFEDKLHKILREVKQNKNVILFIDEIHNIVHAGGAEGAVDASNILKPYLSRGDIQCIGATTFDEYFKIFEKDKAIDRRFQVIKVDELDEQSTKMILESLIPSYELFHEVSLDTSLLDNIIYYCKQYMPTRYFPDKAIDVLDYSFTKAKQTLKCSVEEEDIINVIEQLCKVKVSKETKANSLKNKLKREIIGQYQAIQDITNQISYIEKGLTDDTRPLGVYLFVGPTGVGKTETAKIIADEFFGSTDKLIKLDMSEFMDPWSVSKIIGAAPGYIGYQEQTYLVDEVRKKPHSIILLDEIEKAHKDVLNIFLNVFDEGYLLDSNKRKVDFKNTIIILTSNLGYNNEQDNKKINKSDDSEINAYFKPEFLNRIDEVIYFKPLDDYAGLVLAKRYLKEYLSRIEEDIAIDDEELIKIVSQDDVLKYGARGIRRAVKKCIINKINLTVTRFS